ncbi:MAG: Rrf2 family transcriptional regulator [Bacteroidia bacterium]|nr:Rrf2 family transcriptional regulator [Bacteroidia bacterium]
MSRLISFSEASSIGIHSIVLIAQSKEMINVVKIAGQIGASKHHVAKILQRLVKDEFLSSNRGPYGGFILKKDPSEISLLNIFESIEGPIEISRCAVGIPACPFDEDCLMGDIVNKMTHKFKKYLANATLSEILRKRKKKK